MPSPAHDASGNATGDGTYSYAWDGESQLKTANGVSYTFDGDGRRVSKVGGKLYWYGAGSEILAETDASGSTTAEYVFFGGKRVAMLRPNDSSSPYFYIEDFLGSSSTMTLANGIPCYDADFTPFGGERIVGNTCSANNYKFEGKERDTETGNDDFGARYYSNRFGRWLSADWSSVPVAVPYANLTNPQTLNLYSMVADDPESFADLDGHGPFPSPFPWQGDREALNCPPNLYNCSDPAPPPPPAQNQGWSISWQASESWSFLKEEVKGVADVTVTPIVNAVEHPVQTVENAVSNVAETVKDLAKDPKGTLTTAAGGAKDQAVQFGSKVASGDPRAIGQAVGIAATVAYTAENVRVGAYEHGGGGVNLNNTPFNGNRLAADYHPFGKAGTATASKNVLHVDVKIQQLGINVRHWTP